MGDPSSSKSPDLSTATQKVSAPAKTSSGKQQEFHDEPHIRIRWHVDVLVDGHDLYQGIVKDITTHGADVFLEADLPKAKLVKLRFHVPPLSKTSGTHFMEVSGKVFYATFDGSESLYHTRINFLKFKDESDLANLQSRINDFNRPR